MPGTIQVSVMEFKGLPPTSAPIFLKVSLGKKEYQTSVKGDFSFPLTTLRDNLVVTLVDAEGNEIALTGIQTISIVQKGSWDDIFPFDRGGHVHLKLQFILNEEERNLIYLKRQGAVNSEIASAVGSSVTSAPRAEHKVIDSQTRTVGRVVSLENVAMLGSLLPNPDVFPTGSRSNHEREEGTIFKQEIAKATDTREATFFARTIRGTEAQQIAFEEKIEAPPSLPNVDVNLVSGKERSSDSTNAESDVAENISLVSLRLQADHIDKSQQQVPLEKTTSSVRKLVSAFESSLPKDVKSAVTVPNLRCEPKKVGKGGHLKDSDPKDLIEPAELSSGKSIMNLLESGPLEADYHQKKKSSSASGDRRKNGSDYDMKKHKKGSHSPRKSRSDSSSDDSSGGLLGQAIKIAIIVGFGVLVLFTRQREPRKSKRDENELFFTPSYYMDEQTTTVEQWTDSGQWTFLQEKF